MTLGTQARRITNVGKEIRLTKLEYGVLEFLMREMNHVRTPKEILRNVWGEEYQTDIAVLRAVIRRLRKKIQPVPDTPRYIGTGYSCSDKDTKAS